MQNQTGDKPSIEDTLEARKIQTEDQLSRTMQFFQEQLCHGIRQSVFAISDLVKNLSLVPAILFLFSCQALQPDTWSAVIHHRLVSQNLFCGT